jgi:hypothetical protein
VDALFLDRIATGRRVQRAAIVPDHDVADLPFVAVLRRRRRHVVGEFGDQRFALGLRQALDAHDVIGIGVQRDAARFLVAPHDRMHGGRAVAVLGIEQVVAAPAAAAIDVLGLQPLQALLQALRQRFVGLVHRGEQGVAAIGRDLYAVELRGLADLGVPRRIGVPAAAAIVDRLVDLAVGLARADAHDRQLGILGMACPLHAMRLQPPEARGIGQELGDRERLAAHHQDDGVQPGLVEPGPVGVGERTDVDIGDNGTDSRVGLVDLHA